MVRFFIRCAIKIRPQHQAHYNPFKDFIHCPSTFWLRKKNITIRTCAYVCACFFYILSKPRPNSTALCLDFNHSFKREQYDDIKKKFNKVELIKVNKKKKSVQFSLLKRSQKKICIKKTRSLHSNGLCRFFFLFLFFRLVFDWVFLSLQNSICRSRKNSEETM